MGARNRVGIGLSYRPARLHTQPGETGPCNRFLRSLKVWKFGLSIRIFEQSMGATNRVGIGLSYRPARLHTRPGGIGSMESIFWLLKSSKIRARPEGYISWRNLFLGSWNVYKFGLCSLSHLGHWLAERKDLGLDNISLLTGLCFHDNRHSLTLKFPSKFSLLFTHSANKIIWFGFRESDAAGGGEDDFIFVTIRNAYREKKHYLLHKKLQNT